MATTASDGHAVSSRSAVERAASSTCSQLSSTMTASLPPSAAVTASASDPPDCSATLRGRGDRGDDHARIGDRDQIDEHAPVAPGGGEIAGHGDRQTGLADPARAGHGHHPVLGQRGQQARPVPTSRPTKLESSAGHRSAPVACAVAPVTIGAPGEAAPVADAELAHQGGDVRLDGAHRQAQLVGDLAVRQVRLDEGQHLTLAGRDR